MKHLGWWIVGGLFLLSRSNGAGVLTPVGGSNPVQPADGTTATAIDAGTGLPVTVNQPLQTTILGNIIPSPTFNSLGTGDEAFIVSPPITSPLFNGGDPFAGNLSIGPISPPILTPMFHNPDTIPNAWPGLATTGLPQAVPQTGAAGDPRGGSAMIAAPLFDLTQDAFFVPGLGEEEFSPGALTPDQKLAVLVQQGYTGPDPRITPATPLAAALNTATLVSPITGRVALESV